MHKTILQFLIVFLAVHTQVFAEESCKQSQNCIDIDRWDLALAIGLGSRSNPLSDYENIPVYVVPSIAYYGDNWFFDNGNLGYSLIESERFTINLATTYSDDSGFFNKWDPSNIFMLANGYQRSSVSASSAQQAEMVDKTIDFDELGDRNFTMLATIEGFYFSRFGVLKAAIGHDMFNVHNGAQADFKWNYSIAVDNWVFDTGVSATWKSEDLVDYYYGIRVTENTFWHQQYRASSAWNFGAELTARYLIATHWDALLALRYTKFAKAISDSPLLSDDYSSTYFVGMAYRF
ncbi:MipA/OmpV family protein [Shewanella sp. WXL01]|uniref:MipA/OmpV family protein n=1 Tax=Shewanella maritima TaxID=2520507 RepID=A0A411PFB7_9GAMM|nr:MULTISPECIES: MipA/OmpV family protein [Shewanella]NKF49660.1 MipA/OmpV family protein [Shewanella sp. WXL01]QBF82251.1 MipA/OmpV family protein [Shewanella maritima]